MPNRDLSDFLKVLGFDSVPSLAPPNSALPINEPVSSDMSMPMPSAIGEGVLASGSWDEFKQCVLTCTKCKLSSGRRNVVFGYGLESADLMFVGEGPGADEDIQGLPFVGKAGELLTRMISAMGFSREQVYIANVVKCRPPNNRNPEPDEVDSCSPYLARQIAHVKPKVIVALGTFAAQTLLQTEEGITRMRGNFRPLKMPVEGNPQIKVMPTFHPAYLLRNADMKKPVWEDLQTVMKELKS